MGTQEHRTQHINIIGSFIELFRLFLAFALILGGFCGTYEYYFCHSMNAGSMMGLPQHDGETQTLSY